MKIVKSILAGLIIIILILVGAVFYFVYDLNRPLPDLKEKKIFRIEKGEGVNQVAGKLQEQGIIKNTFNWETYLWLRNQENKLQSGQYELNPGLSARELAIKFIQGNTSIQEIWVTIPEGFTGKDIEKRLVEKNLVKPSDFTSRIKNYKYDFIGQDDYGKTLPTLEGYLFPDTYKFYQDSSIDEIISKMLNNFDKKITTDLRDEIKRQGKTINEVIILASIVEKETSDVEDMKKAAGVFYNRLEIDMLLESDATVNFVIEKNRRQATFEDIKIDSPYNTYKYKGLPPGPISNPGINSIKAAIYPEKTDYLYFLSPEDGSTVFSKTLEEHNLAKAKYLD